MSADLHSHAFLTNLKPRYTSLLLIHIGFSEVNVASDFTHSSATDLVPGNLGEEHWAIFLKNQSWGMFPNLTWPTLLHGLNPLSARSSQPLAPGPPTQKPRRWWVRSPPGGVGGFSLQTSLREEGPHSSSQQSSGCAQNVISSTIATICDGFVLNVCFCVCL